MRAEIHLAATCRGRLAAYNNPGSTPLSPGSIKFPTAQMGAFEKKSPSSVRVPRDPVPLGRLATPRMSADAFAFLLSAQGLVDHRRHLVVYGAHRYPSGPGSSRRP